MEKSSSIPFVDLSSQWNDIKDETIPSMLLLLSRGELIGGKEVDGFEKEFAAYIGAKHCIAFSSGTAALHFALRAMGIGIGDEVITSANTFIATAEAIVLTGATPILVDIEAGGIHPTTDSFLNTITVRTKAIVPVHLYGFPMDLKKLYSIAHTKNIHILEDACQSHGAKINGKIVGKNCEAAAFSFYPSKNLGACGDAGAVVTNDDELASKLYMLRNHGSIIKYDHQHVGSTERMDSIQACILRKKLPFLETWNKKRREIARYYIEQLSDIEDLWLPQERDNIESCYHLFVIRCKQRDELARELNKYGIECGIHYPFPIHLTKAFSFLGKGRGFYPNAEKACATCLSLPIGPHLTTEHVKRVVETIRTFLLK